MTFDYSRGGRGSKWPKTSLPQLTVLEVQYEDLQIVTNNFTRDATRSNCARVNRVIFNKTIVHSKEFYLYFPLLQRQS